MFLSSIRLPSGWAAMKTFITGVSGHPLQNGKFRSSLQDFTSDFTAFKGYWFYSKKRGNALSVLMTSPVWVLYLSSKAGHFGHFKWVFSYLLSILILKMLKHEFNTWNLIGFNKEKNIFSLKIKNLHWIMNFHKLNPFRIRTCVLELPATK